MTLASQRTDYRPDIDGLRAIAVLAVALFHGEIPGFSGGFIGVDVFFVISGFLITRIIAEETARGAFSYLGFYERRARRILPALFTVAAAVIAFTLLYRSPRDADIFGESLTMFAVFAANAFFYNQLNYFADPVSFYPLLHMWSLAVEEQFYLFFPPLFLLLSRRAPGRLRLALGALAALSFLASIAMVAIDPQLAFFHTPFRIWELMAGGLLALSPPLFRGQAAREAAASVGLLALLAPIPLYDHLTPFPGLAAAPPALGAALVIAAGQGGGATLVGRALSWPPMVFVGLVSYSFYLWHWPALSAARYLSFEPLSHGASLGVLAAAFALSVASLYLIERPFRRRGGVLGRKGVFIASAAGIVALLAIGFVLQETKGLPQRFPELRSHFSEDARKYGLRPEDCPSARDALPEALRQDVDPAFCLAHRAGPDRPKLLFWGDSHLWALSPGLALWAIKADVTLYVSWSPVCAPLIGYQRPAVTRFQDCAAQNRATAEAVAALGVERVGLAAQWSRYLETPGFDGMLSETAARIEAAGARPVVIGEAPAPGVHTPTVLFRAAAIGMPHGLDLSREAMNPPGAERLADAARAAGLPLVSVSDLLCADGLCRIAAPNGAPLYADSHHLNRLGSREIGLALGAAAMAAN